MKQSVPVNVIGSELPIVNEVGQCKRLYEIAGNGAYYQVAWLASRAGLLPLYSDQPISMVTLPLSEQVAELPTAAEVDYEAN